MPEGDAVWRAARRLREGLAGRMVTDFDLRWPSAATADFRGHLTTEVVPRGKHLLHRFDNAMTLHTHLRMDGSWKVLPPGAVTRAQLRTHHLRAVVGCDRATGLGFDLGMLDVVPTAREETVVGHLGPDLLGPGWDADVAVANLAADPARAIGAALLDQRNLAGIGTIWDAETLFLERVWPWTPVGELTTERLRAIVERAHTLLTGTLRYPFSVSTGDLRSPTYAHGREGRSCRRCRHPIGMGRVGTPPQDRRMYFCPRCQPAP